MPWLYLTPSTPYIFMNNKAWQKAKSLLDKRVTTNIGEALDAVAAEWKKLKPDNTNIHFALDWSGVKQATTPKEKAEAHIKAIHANWKLEETEFDKLNGPIKKAIDEVEKRATKLIQDNKRTNALSKGAIEHLGKIVTEIKKHNQLVKDIKEKTKEEYDKQKIQAAKDALPQKK